MIKNELSIESHVRWHLSTWAELTGKKICENNWIASKNKQKNIEIETDL